MDLGSGLGKLVVQAREGQHFKSRGASYVSELRPDLVESEAYLEWPSVRRSVGIEIAAERAKSASQVAS